MKLELEPLGYIESPYQEKFSVPRQPGLVSAARTRLPLIPPYNAIDMVQGLAQFSHLWLIFGFHQNHAAGWKPKVRPPRLGGNQKIGVFASRSSFRPNNLGMSVMPLIGITTGDQGPVLEFAGGDLVQGTPVYDIKPYIPYADSIEHAQAGYAQQAPVDTLGVIWSEQALNELVNLALTPQDQQLIEQVLAQDPRPAYKKNKADPKHYGVALLRYNITWRVQDAQILILRIEHN